MSAFWEWGIAIFSLLVALWQHLTFRTLRRQHEQLRSLTRRVWLLEGGPRGDA